MEMPAVYRPIPRRAFEITPASTDSSHPPSPVVEPLNPDLLASPRPDTTPSRTRSILNLTSSTLLGIYSPMGAENREELSTPWGTGAQTPSKRGSIDDYKPPRPAVSWTPQATVPRPQHERQRQRRGFRGYVAPLLLQTALLFLFGVGYGSIITHLHKTQNITPVPVPFPNGGRDTRYYLLSWGVFGILLGNTLPMVDSFWEKTIAPALTSGTAASTPSTPSKKTAPHERPPTGSSQDRGLGPMWYATVRSMGVFVGIAFAVRRVPWQSTLQVALTLALANPVLWYLIDRSLPGFAFSAGVGIIGTLVLLLVDPNFVPVPAIHQSVASEQFGVYAWLASILFCTSLCFGAIGRRLRL